MLTVREKCRLCAGAMGRIFREFPALPVAGAYVRPNADPGADPLFPLTLLECAECGHVQLRESMKGDFYAQYRFATGASGGYRVHLETVADRLQALGLAPEGQTARVLEIGASDGELLELLAGRGFKVAGFEPAMEPARQARRRGLEVVNDFFDTRTARQSPLDRADAVVIRHVLEHIDDFEPIFAGIERIATPETVLMVEVPDLAETCRQRIYGNIYHIHPNYFHAGSLGALLARYGWGVERMDSVPVFGGSLLAMARRSAPRRGGRCPDAPGMESFVEEWGEYLRQTRDFFDVQKKAGRRVAGYGAAERTVSLLSTAGVDRTHVSAIYDANRHLEGLALPGSRIPVRPPARLEADQPDLLAIFARSFEEEIVEQQQGFRKAGGQFVSLRSAAPRLI
ncbi:MAG: class I SAM-dependent methyltransferase [Bryobacteraceae bacterium]